MEPTDKELLDQVRDAICLKLYSHRESPCDSAGRDLEAPHCRRRIMEFIDMVV